ncbi:LysR family transcriptional regulator [Lacrimispora indolis]|uniref:LysR family transcriptional regulator n=1 Tax=Lacrimispora indolis TaxID=69825 RepID=UPI000428A189|nr:MULTISPECIES: LysR family transcriptional regulator [Lachnospiraceae]MBE7720382.1 LysR family transcriptional regulator [Lacrimispora celerecrescens]
MELKQLEYFLVACERGSLNKAAEALFTSQPNVSKAISALEKELGYTVFERTSKGLRLTEKGKSTLTYAQNIVKNLSVMKSLNKFNAPAALSLSSYPSNMIAHILVDLCKENAELVMRHQQGSVEEITSQVGCGEAEIGILYVAQKQLQAFRHIIAHKKLEYQELDIKEACIYVGPHHPMYQRDSIDISELGNLRFVRGTQEYFSMEHHLEQVSLGTISTEQLHYAALTNSDHLTIDLLLHTDVCSLSINFMCSKYEQYDIRMLPIRNCEPFLSIGYVYEQGHELSPIARKFLQNFQAAL